MENRGAGKYIALAVFGFVLMLTGLMYVIRLPGTQGMVRTLPAAYSLCCRGCRAVQG